MYLLYKSRNSARQAIAALILTMCLTISMLIVFASMMDWVTSESRMIQRNNQYVMSQAAAEAVTEVALSQMMHDYMNQSLSNASSYVSMALTTSQQTNYDGTAWPIQYKYSDMNGSNNQLSVLPGPVQTVLQPLGSQYANLMGYPQFWTNVVTATPIGQPYAVSATVTQIVNFSTVPVFQYAIFYNLNLEIDPGATMFVNGPVWSNAGIWAGTANLTFNNQVSAVSNASIASIDPFCTLKTDANAPPHFNMSGQPTSGNTALTMPIAGATNANPTNVESILNIPPPAFALGSTAAYTTNGQIYLANEADLLISNAVWGLSTNIAALTPAHNCTNNISIWYQDQNLVSGGPLLQLQPDYYIFYYTNTASTNHPAAVTHTTNWISPNKSDGLACYTNVIYAGWSFVTNATFYDYREKAQVQAVQIMVTNLTIWCNNALTNGGSNVNYTCALGTHKSHQIDAIWVYNAVPPSPLATLPAVRVTAGAQLNAPKGLTVSTPMPIYVYGDFNKQTAYGIASGTNTTYTYPGALMGDAITILSANWSDSYTSATALASRTTVATTVNAACLEGIVQSIVGTSTPNGPGGYSGGTENFIRFLENWSSTTTYNGSIVVMFPSIYATNSWITTGSGGGIGAYYNAPTRSWGFDYKFTQASNLPPCTPSLKKTVRVSWGSN